MSFGTNNTTKAAQNNLGGTSNLALNDFYPKATTAGTGLLNTGQQTAAPGVSFLNTVLGGNRANTTALLQPQIDQLRQGVAGTRQAVSTLMPRGGGRYGSQFGLTFAPQAQMQGLFNPLRSSAATALPQIGLQEEGLGTNLFGLGGQGLNTAANANSTLAQSGLQAQQTSNSLFGQLGSGLFGLASLPVKGGGTLLPGLLGLGV